MSSFEENLQRLEAIAASLDRDDLSLEQALSLFEEGIAKLKEASAELTKAEGRVKTLVEKAAGVFEVTDDRG
ncbi:MAG: exodeoxyribonuclease VII small subunit [Gemmatimonadales bacterium]